MRNVCLLVKNYEATENGSRPLSVRPCIMHSLNAKKDVFASILLGVYVAGVNNWITWFQKDNKLSVKKKPKSLKSIQY